MLEVHYFAGYRERLGLDRERLDWQPQLASVEQLRQSLVARGGAWSALAAQNLMCARNQELCGVHEPLADGDEVAFFPPVTGG
ncbi:molybdopterin converting factor subunit 1 [Pseudomonas chengduensis]|jgi:molybdopterin synthase sulfur carrier subunit|uniref:molybdopterin converting factor subunit 1 n=1 Tax=Pseudomonas sp. TaxID=306 RepID=UPI0024468D1B|nr:molybdopterin converting factor subunit 1 [Pseudomonas chengduensis]MDH0959347.1 molybdopterin converting factor subunit 1 [Pseudomonas chengduensis]MDH1536862.1 molybdopterin converting factor subunit 1 [Pseudomonas chengduensis]